MNAQKMSVSDNWKLGEQRLRVLSDVLLPSSFLLRKANAKCCECVCTCSLKAVASLLEMAQMNNVLKPN